MGTIITISALALGLAFGIFIVIRLRAEPVEDLEEEERIRLRIAESQAGPAVDAKPARLPLFKARAAKP